MTDDKLFEKLSGIIYLCLSPSLDEDEVVWSADFVNDLGADSLDRIELLIAIENAFDIDIPDEDAERLRTVQDVIDYLQPRVAPVFK